MNCEIIFSAKISLLDNSLPLDDKKNKKKKTRTEKRYTHLSLDGGQ